MPTTSNYDWFRGTAREKRGKGRTDRHSAYMKEKNWWMPRNYKWTERNEMKKYANITNLLALYGFRAVTCGRFVLEGNEITVTQNQTVPKCPERKHRHPHVHSTWFVVEMQCILGRSFEFILTISNQFFLEKCKNNAIDHCDLVSRLSNGPKFVWNKPRELILNYLSFCGTFGFCFDSLNAYALTPSSRCH